jgi:hypothetical protein
LIASPACVSRKRIKAAIWLNTGIPKALCDERPELYNLGFYRQLNNGKWELVSYCSEHAAQYLTIYSKDLEKILDETLPKEENVSDYAP